MGSAVAITPREGRLSLCPVEEVCARAELIEVPVEIALQVALAGGIASFGPTVLIVADGRQS